MTLEIIAGTLVTRSIHAEPNKSSYVPYYQQYRKETPVKSSSVTNNILSFFAPKDGIYEYKNNAIPFSDTDNHWAKNTIDFITARELFAGVGDGKFDPDGGMTRAMFAAVLARLDDADLSNYASSVFADVDINTWYGPAVNWATEKGILAGYGNGVFGATDSITREQIEQVWHK